MYHLYVDTSDSTCTISSWLERSNSFLICTGKDINIVPTIKGYMYITDLQIRRKVHEISLVSLF